MLPPNEATHEQRLNALFHAYRDACEAPEASANFMPELWQKIEARQRFSFSFGRIARGFVTAAIAAALAMGIWLSVPRTNGGFYAGAYVDILSASRTDAPDTEAVRFDPTVGSDEI
jgi:hypothetical protein